MKVRISLGWQSSGQVVHGSGVGELTLRWRNSLTLYVNDETRNSTTSHLTLGWVFSGHRVEVRGDKKVGEVLDREVSHELGTGAQF